MRTLRDDRTPSQFIEVAMFENAQFYGYVIGKTEYSRAVL